MSASHQPGRYPGLDALRGLAAVSVMLFHYTSGDNAATASLAFAFPCGNLGVELFFIISGFVIVMTLARTRSLRAFVTARAARLYPSFVACAGTTVLVSYAFDHAPGQADAAVLAANLTMIPVLLGAPVLDASYWTLQFELVFYAFAALVMLSPRVKDVEAACLIWLVAALIVRIFWPDQRAVVTQVTAAWFAQLFVIGIMLYRLRCRQGSWRTVVCLCMALCVASLGPYPSSIAIGPLGFGVIICGFAALVWFATSSRGVWLDWAPLRFLGRLSYPLYLLHQVVGAALMKRMVLSGFEPNLALLCTIAVIVLMAWAISESVEWPAQRWIRRFQANAFDRTATARI